MLAVFSIPWDTGMTDLRSAFACLKAIGFVADERQFSIFWLRRTAGYFTKMVAANANSPFFLCDELADRLEKIVAVLPDKSPVARSLTDLAHGLRQESQRQLTGRPDFLQGNVVSLWDFHSPLNRH